MVDLGWLTAIQKSYIMVIRFIVCGEGGERTENGWNPEGAPVLHRLNWRVASSGSAIQYGETITMRCIQPGCVSKECLFYRPIPQRTPRENNGGQKITRAR